MTQRLDKINKTDKVRGPNSNLAINGPEAQNKHSSPDKIRRLHLLTIKSYKSHKRKYKNDHKLIRFYKIGSHKDSLKE